MTRARVLLPALALVLGQTVFLAGTADAATGVTIGTIKSRTVAHGAKTKITPVVTKRGKTKIVSKKFTVTRSGKKIAKNAKSASLPAGTYKVATAVVYKVKKKNKYGKKKTKKRTQTLIIKQKAAPKPATPAAKPPAPTTTPCGPVRYKADGSAWTCTLAEDFDGTALNTKWWSGQQTAVSGMRVGEECLVDDPDNLSVSEGVLRLTTREESEPFTCNSPYGAYTTRYSSAGITSFGKFSQTYGRFEFRAKFPAGKTPGLQTSLWMYPTSLTYGQWPLSGEIDVAEFYSRYPDRAIPYLHYSEKFLSTAGRIGATNWQCMLDPTMFHTYAVEWTASKITILYDDQVCISHTISAAAPLTGGAPFDKPFTLIVTQVLGGGESNRFVPGTTTLPATTEVDWIRAWK